MRVMRIALLTCRLLCRILLSRNPQPLPAMELYVYGCMYVCMSACLLEGERVYVYTICGLRACVCVSVL